MFLKKRKLIKQLEERVENYKGYIAQLEDLLSYYSKKSKAVELLDGAKKEFRSKDYANRLALVEKTLSDFNYRDIITKTKSGKVCLDIFQIFLTEEEINNKLR